MMKRDYPRGHRRGELVEVERRSWRIITLSVVVTVLLAVGIAAFFYPVMKWRVFILDPRIIEILPQLIIGLLSLVILEAAYVVVKQRELSELRALITVAFADAETGFLETEQPKDPLTGILDRRALPELLKRESSWVDRYRIPLCLVLFDIRDFGKFNERAGNMAGDVVLKEVAQTLQATVRQTDSVLRYGADEFLCLLPRTDSAGGAAFIRRVGQASQRAARLRDFAFDTGSAVYQSSGDVNVTLAHAERNLATQKKSTTAPTP